jgi:hypothetical protein
VSKLITFLRQRLTEDAEAIRLRDLNLPIHFVGCYYYSNTLDAGLHCDCNEDASAEKKYIADIHSKHKIIDRCRNMPDVLLLLALPYKDHPDYEEAISQVSQGS